MGSELWSSEETKIASEDWRVESCNKKKMWDLRKETESNLQQAHREPTQPPPTFFSFLF